MKNLIDATFEEGRTHFLKGSSYFNNDLPDYLSFEPILEKVSKILKGQSYNSFGSSPAKFQDVNYSLVANKDGRFSWRPYEMMHPVIYVSLVNTICCEKNWAQIKARLASFENGSVLCCSSPVISQDANSDQAANIQNWWQKVEQKSIELSLEYSHVLNTDVTDCYGALYTHSIAWALEGLEKAKKSKGNKKLLGNQIDKLIQDSRYGQTNGICQGSVLMDFIAEIVLGYVDSLITEELGDSDDFRILRYRDDYRIFANSDQRSEEVLKVVSDKLRLVGMRLGVAKTFISTNVIAGSIKEDKLSGISLQDLGETNAKTIQKQLLRLHTFGRKFPNSGALRRLVGDLHVKISKKSKKSKKSKNFSDLKVQIAIATDIAVVSPATFPAIAATLSHLISLADPKDKSDLWGLVQKKMTRVPYNGYLEIWLQRVIKPLDIQFESNEAICLIVDGRSADLWESKWIKDHDLSAALSVSQILVKPAEKSTQTIPPEEIELFTKNAWSY